MTRRSSPSERRGRRPRAARGFTLIELVVAGTVAALVLGAVTFALSQLAKSRNIARDRVEAFQRASTALENMRRDIVAALRSDDLFDCRFLLRSATPGPRTQGRDRSELLVFSRSMRATHPIDYQGEGNEFETAYRVEDDELGSALWRRRDAVPDDVPDGGGVAEPIADGIVAMTIEASEGDGGWTTDWDSDADGMPKLVRVTVTATGAPVGKDAEALTPEVTLRTLVAIDRVVPPKPDEPPPEDPMGNDASGQPGAEPGTPGGTAAPGGGAIPNGGGAPVAGDAGPGGGTVGGGAAGGGAGGGPGRPGGGRGGGNLGGGGGRGGFNGGPGMGPRGGGGR
jgi:type II secretion system protein J